MNSKQKGGIGVAAAVAYFAKKGDIVYLPLSESGCDLIVDRNGSLLRVEVKSTWKGSIDLRTNAGWYTKANLKPNHISDHGIDIVIGYNAVTDTISEFSMAEIGSQRSVKIK